MPIQLLPQSEQSPWLERYEKPLIIVILIILLIVHLELSFYLKHLGVLAQYDVMFDADPSVYVNSLAKGWEFDRDIHPGIGLLFNIPARLIDLTLASTGLIRSGEFLAVFPYLFSPLLSFLAGLFWWLAAREIITKISIRVFGFLLFQLAFSQSVFSVVPESYSASGALLALMLWLSIKSSKDPSYLIARKYLTCWILLACVMSMVTVTMGALCFLVWSVLAALNGYLTRFIRLYVLFGSLLAGAIVATIFIDRMVFQLDESLTRQLSDTVSITQRFIHPAIFQKIFSLPMHLFSGVLPPSISVVENRGFEEVANSRYDFAFSIETSQNIFLKIAYWIAFGCLLAQTCTRLKFESIYSAILVVLVFNAVLHLFFGSEYFLYSQHWLAFLVMWIVLVCSFKHSAICTSALAGLVVMVALQNYCNWLVIIEYLKIHQNS